jgi:hypothetical protein
MTTFEPTTRRLVGCHRFTDTADMYIAAMLCSLLTLMPVLT